MQSLPMSCYGQLTSALGASEAIKGSPLVAQPYTVPSAVPHSFFPLSLSAHYVQHVILGSGVSKISEYILAMSFIVCMLML